MNKVILMGRLTRDPDIKHTNTSNGEDLTIARYTLAVDRKYSRGNGNGQEQAADFISCVAFGSNGNFAERFLKQGTKIAVTGRIQTGSYTNKEGQKIYTTEVVVEEHEFAESKKNDSGSQNYYPPQNNSTTPSGYQQGTGYNPGPAPMPNSSEGFMNVADFEDELPFGQNKK